VLGVDALGHLLEGSGLRVRKAGPKVLIGGLRYDGHSPDSVRYRHDIAVGRTRCSYEVNGRICQRFHGGDMKREGSVGVGCRDGHRVVKTGVRVVINVSEGGKGARLGRCTWGRGRGLALV